MKTVRILLDTAIMTVLLTAAVYPQFSEQYAGALTGMYNSSAAWGDYDNDGRLDLLVSGWTGSNAMTKLYRNTGAGFTEVYPSVLPPVATASTSGEVAWGDFDNDGLLDILLVGSITRIYRNTGSGFTSVYPGALPGSLLNASGTWVDYNNDGRLDIIVSGYTGSSYLTLLFRNTGSGFTSAQSLAPAGAGSVACGDYDNDGRIDLVLTGSDGTNVLGNIYQNGTVGFIQRASVTGVYFSATAWGDYDNDGRLDLLIAGYTGTVHVTKLYRNTGTGFTEVYAGTFYPVGTGTVAWGDCDNDGLLDILLTGTLSGSKIYRNTGSGFTEVYAGTLPGVADGSASWGDYDNDGRLDIALTGRNSGGVAVAKIYHNTNPAVNTTPIPPAGLSASASCDTVRLSWGPGSDPETPAAGLGYNVRVGSVPSGIDLQSPMAVVSAGWRRVAQLGSANGNTAWKIRDLPNGTYYWSVQSVDHAFAGSPFAVEGSFTIMPGFSAVPAPLAFGAVGPGTSKLDSITVTNTGNDTLLITGVTNADPRFVAITTSGSIAPAASKKFYVTFTPDAIATFGDVLSFTDNAPGSPHTISLTGTGSAFSERYPGSLTGMKQSAVAWGDYDNDGLLDLLMTGYNGTIDVTKLYRNTGSGFTEVFAGLFPPIAYGAVAWGDYNNDGLLDLLMTRNGITQIFRNTGSGFAAVSLPIPGLIHSSVAWGDYDNDGRLDIVAAGHTGSYYFAAIFRNTGSGFVFAYNLPPVADCAVAWGDYDNDGRLDVLITGSTGSSPLTMVYRNTGSGFTPAPVSLPGLYLGSAAWGDYDNDGKLDILLTGYDGSTPRAWIFRNTGSGFTTAWSFPGVVDGSAVWGDCDNDGLLDVLLTGSSSGGIISKIYRNTGPGFTEAYAGTLTGVFQSSVAWGDYDNDGRLDIILTGSTMTGSTLTKLYHNNLPSVNTVPSAPSGLSASASCDTVRLGWSPGSDPETPSTGLGYNVRLGTAPLATDRQSPMADAASGWRRIVQLGNANENRAWKIRDLPNGTYYWSVQSIDHAFAGSPFAAEGSFTIMPGFSAADTLAIGLVEPGGSKIDSILVTNPGNDTLNIAGVSSNDARYSVVPGSGSIAPLASMKFYVTFTPGGTGASGGSIVFTHNALDSPDTVVVTGTGGTLTIAASAGPHGTIDPAGEIIVSFDASQRFLFIADEGFHVDSVLADDALIPDSTEAYTFNNVVTDHTIRVTFALSPVTITTHVEARWNIVSLPVDIDPAIKTVLYPDAIGDAYCYETLDYAVEDSLTIGCAYWMKFPAAIDIPLTGLPCESLVVQVDPGWNMVGSLTAAFPVSYIVSGEPGLITGPFFGYDQGYVISDTLRPGVGYWFKSSKAGVLILSTKPPAGPLAGNTLRIVASEDMPPTPPDGGAAEIPGIPGAYALGQAYPNPFNPAVTIAYQLPAESRVTLKIYNALGQVAAILVDGDQSAGYKSVTWNAPDAASGVYFYRLVAVSIEDPGRSFTNVMKAVLLK